MLGSPSRLTSDPDGPTSTNEFRYSLLVVDEPGWYVIDFSLFESNAAEVQFATDFAQRLYRRKGQPNSDFPMHLFVDEADRFVPQRPAREKGEGSETTMLGAFEAIVRRGGLRGLGTTLISQRSAVVNKNVLEQVDVLIVLRTVGPNDRGRVTDIVSAEGTPEQITEIKTSMASLDLGEAWFWEPGEGLFQRIRVRERRTFNSSATPKPGEKRVEPRRLASVDLEAIKERWADTIERAKADDPKFLRKRITELERHLRDAQKATPESVVERVEVPVVHAPSLEALDEIMSGAMHTYVQAETLHRVVSKLRAEPVAPSGRNDTQRRESKLVAPARGTSPRVAGTASTRGTRPSVPTGDETLSGPMRKLLTVLATYGPRTKRQLALLAGYSIGGGAFNNPLGRIRSLGYVDPPKGEPIAITDAGLAALGEFDPLPSGPDLLDHWLTSLPGPARKLLAALAERWPDSYTREELAEVTGYEPRGGAFNNPLGKLRTLELVARGADIRLTDDFGEAIS